MKELGAEDIEKILPEDIRPVCQVGICNPEYLERKKPLFCPIPQKYGGSRPSAKPSDVLPSVKSNHSPGPFCYHSQGLFCRRYSTFVCRGIMEKAETQDPYFG